MILGQRYQLEFRLVSTSTLTAGYKEHLLQLLVLSNSAVIESYLSILLNLVSRQAWSIDIKISYKLYRPWS